MRGTKQALVAAGLVVSTAITMAPAHYGGVAHAAVRPQTVSDIQKSGYFILANGSRVSLQNAGTRASSAVARTGRRSGGNTAAPALTSPPSQGTGTFANVRANQDFGFLAPHQTVGLAEEPPILNAAGHYVSPGNSFHLTAVAEDARLGEVLAAPNNLAPNSYIGFYNSTDGGKTFSDGLVQNIANDAQYPSVLGGQADFVHGRYSFANTPRAAFNKFGDLFVVASATVETSYITSPGGATFDPRSGLSDIIVARSSTFQNTGNPGAACPNPGTSALSCSFDNPYVAEQFSNPGLDPNSGAIQASGRFFDGVQLAPVNVNGTANLALGGYPYVVDTNDAAGITAAGGLAGVVSFVDEFPNIAVDNRTFGSQTIYVVWDRLNLATGTIDLYYSESTDGGNTFSKPLNIDPTDATDCISVQNPASGLCDANRGAYPVVDSNGNLHIVFTNLNAVSGVAVPTAYAADTLQFPVAGDTRTVGLAYHQLLEVVCTTCAGGGAPNFADPANTFTAGSAIFLTNVVEPSAQFDIANCDNGAIFSATSASFASASADPLTGEIHAVWSDARPNFHVGTSTNCAGTASGGARVWEVSDFTPATPGTADTISQVAADSSNGGDADQLFPSITQAFSPNVGLNTYVTFYNRTDAAGTNPYQAPGNYNTGNSSLNYVIARNTVGAQVNQGAGAYRATPGTIALTGPAGTTNVTVANSSPMPLPLANDGGQLFTAYTQSVADTGGVHSAFVDTRANVKNFNFAGAEDIVTTYIR